VLSIRQAASGVVAVVAGSNRRSGTRLWSKTQPQRRGEEKIRAKARSDCRPGLPNHLPQSLSSWSAVPTRRVGTADHEERGYSLLLRYPGRRFAAGLLSFAPTGLADWLATLASGRTFMSASKGMSYCELCWKRNLTFPFVKQRFTTGQQSFRCLPNVPRPHKSRPRWRHPAG